MADKHEINHDVVNDTVARLTNGLTQDVSSMEQQYYNVRSSIDNLDSAAHAAFIAGILRNQRKATVTVEVLCKLLNFVKNASEEYRHRDKMLAYQVQQMAEAIRPKSGGGGGVYGGHTAEKR